MAQRAERVSTTTDKKKLAAPSSWLGTALLNILRVERAHGTFIPMDFGLDFFGLCGKN